MILSNDLIESMLSLPKYTPKEYNKIALRTCRYCKKQAYSTLELNEFVSAKAYKFQKRNLCKNCYALMSAPRVFPGAAFSIVGEYCKLPKHSVHCKDCGLTLSPSTRHLFIKESLQGNISYDSYCKSCRLKRKAERAPKGKPKSLAVKDFSTHSELLETSEVLKVHTQSRPEDFMGMLQKAVNAKKERKEEPND